MLLDDFIKKNKVRTDPRNGVYKITPEFADYGLSTSLRNPRGRTLQSTIDKYAEDMKAGEWTLNGEPIIFNEEGRLQEGHHRLMAVIRSDTTIESYVVFDAPVTDRYNYGAPRTICGELGVSSLVANISKFTQHFIDGPFKRKKLSGGVAIAFAKKYLDTFKLAEDIVKTGKRSPINKPVCGVVTAAMLRSGLVREDDLRLFFYILNTGRGDKSPIYAVPALVAKSQLEYLAGTRENVYNTTLAVIYNAILEFVKNKHKDRKRGFQTNPDEAISFVREAFKDGNDVELAA